MCKLSENGEASHTWVGADTYGCWVLLWTLIAFGLKFSFSTNTHCVWVGYWNSLSSWLPCLYYWTITSLQELMYTQCKANNSAVDKHKVDALCPHHSSHRGSHSAGSMWLESLDRLRVAQVSEQCVPVHVRVWTSFFKGVLGIGAVGWPANTEGSRRLSPGRVPTTPSPPHHLILAPLCSLSKGKVNFRSCFFSPFNAILLCQEGKPNEKCWGWLN